MHAGGRPKEYTIELFEEVMIQIETRTVGVAIILKEDERFPVPSTFWKWLSEDKQLSERYTRAKELQAEILAGQIIAIADTPRQGTRTVSGSRMNRAGQLYDFTDTHTGDNVERAKLMIDARKWMAAHLAPNKYGAKLDVTSGNKPLTSPPTTVIFKNPNNEEDSST